MGISDIIMLASGIAFFLFGMSLMGDGLKKVSGNKLEPILFKLSGTPIKGILLGTGVTAVIQSSSATSVMTVGFVNSGMMKVRQAVYVILGAILGTSITGWVICLSYIDSSSELGSLLSTATLTGIISVAGIVMRMTAKNQTVVHVTDIMLGFAVLMFGMSSMSGSVSSLGSEPWFTSLITSLTNPIMGILIGIFISTILQSASAAVGILQALSVTGAVSFGAALPLLMGISIGASVPVLLSAFGAGRSGRRTAVSYLLSNILGVIVIAAVFYILNGIFRFSIIETIVNPFSIAFVNTLLRLGIVCLIAPFIDVVLALGKLIIREKDDKNDMLVNLEERFLAYPALAVEQSRSVIYEMARESQKSVVQAINLLENYTPSGKKEVEKLEADGDRYEDALGAYLMKVTSKDITLQQSNQISVFLHSLSDLERISDHALNISENAQEMYEKHLTLSESAVHELTVVGSAIQKILDLTFDSFQNEDLYTAQRVEPLEEVVDMLCDEVKMRHVDRLKTGDSTIEQGFVINDLLTNFERISDHCSNIAVAIIELNTGISDPHGYLETLKEKRTPDFEKNFESFRDEFAL